MMIMILMVLVVGETNDNVHLCIFYTTDHAGVVGSVWCAGETDECSVQSCFTGRLNTDAGRLLGYVCWHSRCALELGTLSMIYP